VENFYLPARTVILSVAKDLALARGRPLQAAEDDADGVAPIAFAV